ncbi:hypothetical protein WA158_001568 [Blastocystis sp. Blastoise]
MKQIVLCILCICIVFAAAVKPKLYLREDGTFTIEQFTDLHYGDGDHDDETTQIMRTIIGVEKPDFIAFTGDMVAGYGWDKQPGWYEKKWNAFTAICNETKTYYGYALGNHDSEADYKKKQIIELDQTNPWSMSQLSPPEAVGASNFVVPVYSSVNTTHIAFNMWFFDSMDYVCHGFSGYGCVEPETINWYVKKSEDMEKQLGYKIPGVAFFHIPTQEYMVAWNHYNGLGCKREPTSCSSLNTGLIVNMIKRGDIRATYVGHDHNNFFQMDFNGITLAYGRKTGVGCYGPDPKDKRGGRTIVIKPTDSNDIKIDSWITNELGEREYLTTMTGITEMQDVCVGANVPRNELKNYKLKNYN